jgi:hypothetical protein
MRTAFVLAVEVQKILSLHNQPYSLYGIEVGRIRSKIQRLEEVPIEAFAFVPGGIVKNKDVSFPGRGDRLCRLIEEGLKDIIDINGGNSVTYKITSVA